MTFWDQKLMRLQLYEKIKAFKGLNELGFDHGWIRIIREALGMTTIQLGKRIGVNHSRIVHIEKSELDGSLKLSTMKKVARGLNMHFVYGFVSQADLEDIVRTQAQKLAEKRLAKLDHTMKLELQGLGRQEKEKSLADMTQRILIEENKRLWDEQ